ncbi:MAG: DHH family phosphoesterase [Anaerolineae bacterium]|jgi:phosphoesterase RecJ-like protein|nr:DHH family phosphoesterase [Anaerolineae bacterium]
MTLLDQQIRERFAAAQRIAVISHIRPDGDAIGSVLGLGTALQEAGKDVQFVLADGISAVYRFLKNAGLAQKEISGEIDLAVVVDCSDLERTGGVLGERQPEMNIDHHVTNLHYAQVNLVEDSAATAEIIAKHLPQWGLPFSRETAEALLTGILTDTIGFRTSNVSAETLHTAASLMEHGIDMPDIYHRVLVERTYEAVRLWGRGIDKLQRMDSILWGVLTAEDRKAAAYPGKDDAELISLLSSVRDADVAVLFIEQDAQHVKVSWRARPGFDVSRAALHFGGGGHAPAAGATIEGTLEEVIPRVLDETKQVIEQKKTG